MTDRKKKEQQRISEQRLALGEIGILKLVKFDNDGLREGKWTPEEETYVDRLILDFNSGIYPIPEEMRLRTFLSAMLNCDPMRLSKKFVGDQSIGKKQYRHRLQYPESIARRLSELHELEKRCLSRYFAQ